jgi:type II protein arginine methyltransferase
MLTTPITTPYFHSRVLALHAKYLEESKKSSTEKFPMPLIPPLTAVDTPLRPDDIISQLLAVASPWIDLGSPDPVIHNISRQVLELELAYAAFCGIGNVIVPGPILRHGKLHGDGVMQYALAIQSGLEVGNHIQIEIKLPMVDLPEADDVEGQGSLVYRAREEYTGVEHVNAKKAEIFGTWDAWNLIRTVCNYNARLFVGKKSDQDFIMFFACSRSVVRSCFEL